MVLGQVCGGLHSGGRTVEVLAHAALPALQSGIREKLGGLSPAGAEDIFGKAEPGPKPWVYSADQLYPANEPPIPGPYQTFDDGESPLSIEEGVKMTTELNELLHEAERMKPARPAAISWGKYLSAHRVPQQRVCGTLGQTGRRPPDHAVRHLPRVGKASALLCGHPRRPFHPRGCRGRPGPHDDPRK